MAKSKKSAPRGRSGNRKTAARALQAEGRSERRSAEPAPSPPSAPSPSAQRRDEPRESRETQHRRRSEAGSSPNSRTSHGHEADSYQAAEHVRQLAEDFGNALMRWHGELTEAAAEIGARGASHMQDATDTAIRAQLDAIQAGRRQMLSTLQSELADMQRMLEGIANGAMPPDQDAGPARQGDGATAAPAGGKRPHNPTQPTSSVPIGEMALAGLRLWSAAASGYQRLWLQAAGAMLDPSSPKRMRSGQTARG